jgi:hypothetical protein
VAELNWNVISGGYDSGYVWETEWSFPAPCANEVTITSADIKEHASDPATLFLSGDTKPPKTRISKHPPKQSHDRTPWFRFKANEPPCGFTCKIDRKRWRACGGGGARPKATYRLRRGGHRFKVRATDLAGNTDPTPARYQFTIKRG